MKKGKAEALTEREERRRYLEDLWRRRDERLAAADAREAEREARHRRRLRLLTFGLLGRS